MSRSTHRNRRVQGGAALVEWVIAGPVAILITLLTLQAGLLMVGKSSVNYAAFEAARIGSMHNASLGDIERGFQDAMAPYYGGGKNMAEVIAARLKAKAEIAQSGTVIEILNPTPEAFQDFQEVRDGKVQIPNDNLDRHQVRDPAAIGAASQQNIQDANLLKLRITFGFKPQVPLAGSIIGAGFNFFDDLKGQDPGHALYYDQGRIPLVTEATVRMQSPAFKQASMKSKPGLGTGGKITPGETRPSKPGDNNGGNDGGQDDGGQDDGGGKCPVGTCCLP